MAKKHKPQLPKLVRDFWPKFSSKTATLSLVLSVASIAPSVVALYLLGLFNQNPGLAAILLFIQIVTTYGLLFFLASFTTKPTRHLLSAITYAAGEDDGTTPPNVNDTKLQKSGLSAAIKAVYNAFTEDAPKTKIEEYKEKNPSSLLSEALDNSACGIIAFDSKNNITYYNQKAPVALTPDGTKVLDLVFLPKDSLEAWLEECQEKSVKAEKTWSRVPINLSHSSEKRFYDVIASYNNGLANELIVATVDRTSYYSEGEEELDFIAFAAHELRGPITVIRGYLDVLQDEMQESLDPDHRELFHRLTVSANRLSTYINNILNTSKYDKQHLSVQLKETSVLSVYNQISDDMELRARAQHRVLTVSIPETLPHIAADTSSLSEVFSNLIDNAIKYSNEGGIITVSAASKGDTIEIDFKDKGIGMPGNVVSNLFQKFYRSHRSRETVAGTGIGLYISKAIVESHGGKISVASEDGRGSTFTVILPTYDSIVDKLKSNNDSNKEVLSGGNSWIKNHNTFRG